MGAGSPMSASKHLNRGSGWPLKGELGGPSEGPLVAGPSLSGRWPSYAARQKECLDAVEAAVPNAASLRESSLIPNNCTFLSALLACTLLGAPSVRAQGTFRIEVHPIISLDADAAQALQGKFEGPSRTVAGELRLPFTEEVRVPAVVFLHGDAGALSNQPMWID